METVQEDFDSWILVHLGAAGIALVVIIVLHKLSESRTSPVAAAAFVVAGPVLGLFIIVWHAVREANWREGADQITNSLPNAPDIVQLSLRLLSWGLVAAAISASVAAIIMRDEWFNHLRRVR